MQTISCTGLLTLSPVPPLSHLMEFASLIDFYDFERTDAEPREGAVSTSGIYRQDKGPSLKKGVFTGAMVNHRLRASGLRPRPWHHIEVLIATCGARLRQLRWRFFEPIEQKNRDLISDRRRVLAKNRTNRTKKPELIEPGSDGRAQISSRTLVD